MERKHTQGFCIKPDYWRGQAPPSEILGGASGPPGPPGSYSTGIPLSVLDTFFILNILLFSVFTWYSLSGTNINQQAVAYTSVLATFTVLWLVVFYHVYAYTKISSKLKSKMIDKFTGNILRFKDYLLDMITRPSNTFEYNLLLTEEQPATEPTYSVVELPKPQQPDQPVPEEAITYKYVPSVPVEPVKPTKSVVEVHQSCDLAAPDPEEVTNSLHIPGAAEAAQVKEKEAVSQV